MKMECFSAPITRVSSLAVQTKSTNGFPLTGRLENQESLVAMPPACVVSDSAPPMAQCMRTREMPRGNPFL